MTPKQRERLELRLYKMVRESADGLALIVTEADRMTVDRIRIIEKNGICRFNRFDRLPRIRSLVDLRNQFDFFFQWSCFAANSCGPHGNIKRMLKYDETNGLKTRWALINGKKVKL